MATIFANVTCLFSGLSPLHLTQEHFALRHSLSLTPVCLLLTTTSSLGSTMCGSNFWLEGKTVAPGIEVLSGPIIFHELPYNLVLAIY